jgi:hypothetical protein
MTETLPSTAAELMASFAERTGVTGERTQRRYLWTDAFAVCNFLGLGETDRALALIDRVHHALGRHRSDDSRRGWISGASDADGEAHPTAGGLRIGKPLPEAAAGEPADDRLEWDRDGQYFHYLTKWMHALDRAARTTRDVRLLRWSRELADTAHRHFVYALRGTRRMYWKMSIDLTRPLVASMGHHDPLDGYVTCLELDATGRQLGASEPDLSAAIASFDDMVEPRTLATADPLGIGGLLVDAYRLAHLDRTHPLIEVLIASAAAGLGRYVEQPDLRASANHRLAFRELGLAIGLAAADAIDAPLSRFARLRSSIHTFWLAAEHRRSRAYRDHEDINDVMLATSLAPSGFLGPA